MLRRTFVTHLIAGLGTAPMARRSFAAEPLKMRDLYNKDLTFSDIAHDRDGSRVKITGFMAPPLKADSKFFVLTKTPMSTCPFCETDAEWPDDILAIETKRRVKVIPYNVRILVNGVLRLGSHTDPGTGFVSRVRLTDATYR